MSEHERAAIWRQRLNLSINQLADLTGYSSIAIRWMEKGLTPPRTKAHVAGKKKSGPIPAQVWQRYKNVCAGVEAQLKAGKQFEW